MAPITRPTAESSSDPRSEPPAAPAAPAALAPPPPSTTPTLPSADPHLSQPPAPQISQPPAPYPTTWPDPGAGLSMYGQPQPHPFSTAAPYGSYGSYGASYPSAYPQYPSTSYGPAYSGYPTGYMYGGGLSRHPAGTTTSAVTAPGTAPGIAPGIAPGTAPGTAPGIPPTGPSAREAGAVVLNGMQEAMSRFARVSALLEDVLRHLHMLFDAVFGLGYSVGVFRQEAALWFALKTGPVGLVVRAVRRVATVWRLLCLFFMSPLAGRFSPVALVLRILGLVPDDNELELSVADLFNRGRAALEDAAATGAAGLGDNNIASAPDASHM